MNVEGRLIRLRGTVQGVGLRPWVYRQAVAAGIRGCVRNGAGGVTIEAFGSTLDLQKFMRMLTLHVPPAADVSELSWQAIAPRFDSGFRIGPSRSSGQRATAIPADLPTCAPCLREIFDPSDRRYAYAFTTCTNCGPRFSIARQVPYDRANTSMAAFPMCAACQSEYDSPGDRRFHAETNACADCGPSLAFLDESGCTVSVSDPIAAAAEALAAGRIVAIKGLGGYHLACDAQNKSAVENLRTLKHRETKPFAVMTADLASAARLVELTPLATTMLEGCERPVVLLPRRRNGAVTEQVAPGEGRLGVFLPYTPVHHLLLALYHRPLVMTSANRADEPTAYRDDDAIATLTGIASAFLTHDRDILHRVDDSVAAVVGGRPLVLRRSRGYVPRTVRLPETANAKENDATSLAAFGAHLKNTGCLVVGDQAFLGPHVGDLETFEAYRSLNETMATMEGFLGTRAESVAHDLHPDYLSTRLARQRTAAARVGVQHHHAHIASAMVENGLQGPVLGLAWDGGGLGDDATVWGGELLCADFADFRRLATFRPLRLAGGDLAVREIWRLAVAALDDAYEGTLPAANLPVFLRLSAERVATVRHMLEVGLNSPASHALGRWIDAVASIVLELPQVGHEAQAAVRLEHVASDIDAAPYEWHLDDRETPWQADLRPTVRAVVDDVVAGVEAPTIAARFHETLIAIGAELFLRASTLYGELPLVASGGCFQNDRIVSGLERALSDGGRSLCRNRDIPAGDGGIALGQAAVARARGCMSERRQKGG